MSLPKTPYEVHPYSFNVFKNVVARLAHTTPDEWSSRSHSIYFKEYLGNTGVKAKTFVVEGSYVDFDYLEDFASYYVRCFENYNRKCSRVHFFSVEFTEAEFANLLAGNPATLTEAVLKKEYLGFMVVRPMAHCVVGRTCLVPYADDPARRHFTNNRTYPANLFGIKLEVESLAFQQQDQVVSACATSALWSAFHSTARLFQHHLPPPVEITRAATEHLPVRSRVFPNDGITAEQMAAAIRRVGLEPLYIDLEGSPEFVLRLAAYAYLSYKIPAILITELCCKTSGAPFGLHACTLTGYSLPDTPSAVAAPISSKSNRIDKLYAHDDQVGPFARMELADQLYFHLTTSWGLPKTKGVRAKPKALLVPLYNKIRITYLDVLSIVQEFDAGWGMLRHLHADLEQEEPEWDVRLTGVNEYKQELLHSKSLGPKAKAVAACLELPRYLWRASARTSKGLVIDLLIDATDVSGGRFLRHLHIAEDKLRERILAAHTVQLTSIQDPQVQFAKIEIDLLLGKFSDGGSNDVTAHLDSQA